MAANLSDLFKSTKASPAALFRQRSYVEVCNWPSNTVSYFKDAGYELVLKRTDAWLQFINTIRKSDKNQFGWKIHISVAAENVTELYKILFPEIIVYGITCKFADQATADLHDSNMPPQNIGYNSGKMAVLYYDDRDPEFFLSVCASIEHSLKKRNIAPGKPVPLESDQPLPGSSGYCFYRNDFNPNDGGYSRYGGYNKFNQPDPFQHGLYTPRYKVYEQRLKERPEQLTAFEIERAYNLG